MLEALATKLRAAADLCDPYIPEQADVRREVHDLAVFLEMSGAYLDADQLARVLPRVWERLRLLTLRMQVAELERDLADRWGRRGRGAEGIGG